MIFISGVHGSGKSYFCEKVKDSCGYPSYSASTLIAERKEAGFSSDKLIPDIDDNQQYLLTAIRVLNDNNVSFLLDGHFCLLDANGVVTRIARSTFEILKPEALVLVTENPDIIASRRYERDGIRHDVEDIRHFQNEETLYAEELSAHLGIPLWLQHGSDNFTGALEFVMAHIRRTPDGR